VKKNVSLQKAQTCCLCRQALERSSSWGVVVRTHNKEQDLELNVLDKAVDGDASRPGTTAGPSLKHQGRGCRRTDADQSLGARIWSGHLRRPIAALYSKEHICLLSPTVLY
jgi:hypothetical protein